MSEDLVSVARIARPQGLRGEVIADVLTDFPERFSDLRKVRVRRQNGEILSLELENWRPHKARIVLKFAGYNSIERAEELRAAAVLITRDQLVKLPADTYFDFDLIDCEVTTTKGASVGQVSAVQQCGAAPLLVVSNEEREYLIPLALSICVEIDTAHKRIVIDPPEGLLEL